ncbi:exodeoxyribonuclease V subunit gamma [Capillimicrobium parvum]|uniref:RecBCD enzyme subunit RecC n=1 Tax=Capillimicrobium parvum TaxID=2884022 RepID=A0A9E7C2E7_9ACTN|nr:exodeoxyribonuclease V subunit gamma [Capillimicrobium parvum]UGS38490.1 RecBCD enzyme subunit RecC [Capillimicrobium parvum]
MLHIHRAERADALVDALRALLADPLEDPFAPEVVGVPTRGMERWLTQRLSEALGTSEGRADGVCANVDFPSPRRLTDQAIAAACGIEPDADPWAPERAVWPLLDVVDGSLHEPWLAALAAHLGAHDEQTRAVRRFATVRHLADLFDRYALHRPGIVRAWAAGDDGGIRDGGAWQAELWRRLRVRIDHPDPAERLDLACARLREDPARTELPKRLSLFNLTRLPQGHLDVLCALAAHRDVHLFLLHPSPALWDRVAEATCGTPPIVARRADPTAALAANRLLASWGHDARELQLVVTGHDDPIADEHHAAPHGSATLLERVQQDIRADRAPAGAPLPAQDRSIEIHSCHGRARQVEVLRDAILHLLADDATLEPRDVIVMCPDIETFAPLIHATFGVGDLAGGGDGEDDDPDALADDVRPPDLRVRLADRSLRQTNPILGAVAELLDLAGRRITASELLDFADRDPVRRRFRLDDDDLARLEDWVAESGIRWGLDAAHRAPFKLDTLEAGTWRAGIDRLLVGVTMSEDGRRLYHDVLPLDDVESGAIDLAGRFAELLDRVQHALDALSRTQPIDAWATALADAADALTTTAPRESWQRDQLKRLLDDVVGESGGRVTTLATPEIRALLAERLRGRPTRANFRTGHLTVCTLMPMRSVPHRVVCLLGMDDAQFPRKAPRDGDDLMLDRPRVGDRDPRTEDRQLLLDALMAATDRLVITYTGNDERTNTPRPPAVPVGELLDVIDRAARTADGTPASTHVLVRHPLQPFDPRNFTPGHLTPDRPWSFDTVTLEGARALEAPRRPTPPFLSEPLPPVPDPVADLEALVRFAGHPVRAFLRQRLGISLGEREDEIADALPVELNHLDEWRVGQRLLDARLDGADLDVAAQAERARGTLPPGRLGEPVLARVRPVVEEIATAAERVLPTGAEPGSVDVHVTLPGGRRLTGTVAGVCGDVLRAVTYSRVGPRHRLALWVQWLALNAAHPERAWEAAAVGRARDSARNDARITVARLPPLDGDRHRHAVAHLLALVDLHDRGLREPLPLYCKTSAAYARAAGRGDDALKAGRDEWESPWAFEKEDRELEHQRVLGGVVTFDELLVARPRSDEAWENTEETRFGRYARRLWDGLLAHEEISDR